MLNLVLRLMEYCQDKDDRSLGKSWTGRLAKKLWMVEVDSLHPFCIIRQDAVHCYGLNYIISRYGTSKYVFVYLCSHA